ncbi:MAG: single-stranded DNA-binding protein [Cyanobacteriota bacterium]|jgi:single-strand DNA-binding protein
MTVNTVHLVGRAGRDPEVKYFESGKVVCNFTLAVNRATKKSDEPDWFDLEVWDKTAEVAANYVKKGSLVGIQGSLRFDHWTDRNTGAQRSKPVIRVQKLDLLGSKRDNAQTGDYPSEF